MVDEHVRNSGVVWHTAVEWNERVGKRPNKKEKCQIHQPLGAEKTLDIPVPQNIEKSR